LLSVNVKQRGKKMMEFMRAGGFPIWIVLVFGLGTLVVAGLFIWRPEPRRLAMLRGLTVATCFSVLSGFASCLAAVMSKVPQNAKDADLNVMVMIGIGESLTTAILGFTILSLAWLMGALGQRRLVAAS
jgi:hypothetical protein